MALTPHTLVAPGALVAELDATRARGWAVDDREMAMGTRCVAVPLWVDGRAVAALSLSGPADRLVAAGDAHRAERLSKVAERLAARLSSLRSPEIGASGSG